MARARALFPVAIPVAILAITASSLFLLVPLTGAEPMARLEPQDEREDMPPAPPSLERRTSPPARIVRGAFTSVQVNVDGEGQNVVGDAANEPSIAVDPTNPAKMVIGWRQFDSATSNFREAGVARSSNGGLSWVAGVIDNGVFRSDPVLSFDKNGVFQYLTLRPIGSSYRCELYSSTNGGLTWPAVPVDAYGGDKQWITTDRGEPESSAGVGNLYSIWNATFSCCGSDSYNRSVDEGASFEPPLQFPEDPYWGTVAVGPDGEVYAVGIDSSDSLRMAVVKSITAQDAGQSITFSAPVLVDLGGRGAGRSGPNPGGILGQIWIDVDRSDSPRRGWVYVVGSVDPSGTDPLDIFFTRSTNGGATFSAPLRLSSVSTGWQWFGTLGVSPEGRIDVVWNDTRNDPGGFDSELYHVSSLDGGSTWSKEEVMSPPFDPHLGWPQQNKIGDYYHIVSNHEAAHLAYSATFNGEQDVYYLRIPFDNLFLDGFESGDTSAWSSVVP